MDRLTQAEFWAKLSIPILISTLGGIVRSLQRTDRCSWKSLAIGTLTSGFTGMCVHLLISDLAVSDAVRAGIVGVSGFASGDLLKVLSSRVCKVAKGE
ncbi:phage holin family protein [Maridesulfovibrio ferrireducens]|uniref:phage holin family protein n=1 Tax=Maridesulfovibrio ferrireducens TaxID=246191 RepID=UPI001A1AAB70|nr:phage holin family protein [Maridesulfovibrio ferrireducens]MBI9113245.1 phage holin family protein [Maridesulfovibrio ferrireducens]